MTFVNVVSVSGSFKNVIFFFYKQIFLKLIQDICLIHMHMHIVNTLHIHELLLISYLLITHLQNAFSKFFILAHKLFLINYQKSFQKSNVHVVHIIFGGGKYENDYINRCFQIGFKLLQTSSKTERR